MTDTNAGQAGGSPAEQTIPLVPDAGFAQPALPPLPEETLVDPMATLDPWASGPGLGQARAAEPTRPLPDIVATQPIPSVPAAPAPATPAPMAPAPPAPAGPAFPAQPSVGGYGAPGDYPRPAPSWTAPPTVAPTRPAATYAQPPYADAYPEPNGPAASIGNQPYPTYAASGYAGQAWQPAIVDPVAHDYGYRGAPASPHPNAAISMVLGILGIVAFGPLAPIAWYLAARGRREMSYDPARWRPSGMLTAGLVLGIIGTALLGLGVLFVLLMIGALATFGP